MGSAGALEGWPVDSPLRHSSGTGSRGMRFEGLSKEKTVAKDSLRPDCGFWYMPCWEFGRSPEGNIEP